MSHHHPQDRKDVRSHHFSRTLWIFMLLIGLCFGVLYFSLGHYTEADKIAYDQLIHGEITPASEIQVSKQRRMGLQKNIFFYDKNQRLEFQLTSAQSELALEKKDRHIEIVEHLQDVICRLQESVYFILPDGRLALPQLDGRLLIKDADPQDLSAWISDKEGLQEEQTVLVLKADHAVYYYKGGLFVAKNVHVLRYIAPGHDLENFSKEAKLITDGIASKIEFSIAEKGLSFKSDHFKAKFSIKPEGR